MSCLEFLRVISCGHGASLGDCMSSMEIQEVQSRIHNTVLSLKYLQGQKKEIYFPERALGQAAL
jgi:hypothetical protein